MQRLKVLHVIENIRLLSGCLKLKENVSKDVPKGQALKIERMF
jgi:hypothetical protein